jgi:hypothetical protein
MSFPIRRAFLSEEEYLSFTESGIVSLMVPAPP